MRVLLVDGHPEPPGRLAPIAAEVLESAGHEVQALDLAAEGFAETMSAAERAAYHRVGENLVTDPQQRSAALLRGSDALLVCTTLRAGAMHPLTKSWFERVFVPGVSFTFTRTGRITAALTNLRRVGMLVDSPTVEAEPHHRDGSTRSVLRGVRINAHRLCRTTYASVNPPDDARAVTATALARW